MARAKSVLTPTSQWTLEDFPALQAQPVQNLATGEHIHLSDLVRVKVPTGGIVQWVVDAVNGPQMLPELEGIVIAQALIRTLYARTFEESGGTEAPLCFSSDSLTAHWNRSLPYPDHWQALGPPTEHCQNCPFSQWGTRPKGRGQACQQRRLLMLLSPRSQLPWLVAIPASGLKAVKQYLIGLQALGLEYWQVLTSISLIETKNLDGIKFSRPYFVMREKLPVLITQAAKAYKTHFEQQLFTQKLANTYPGLPSSIEGLAASSESVVTSS